MRESNKPQCQQTVLLSWNSKIIEHWTTGDQNQLNPFDRCKQCFQSLDLNPQTCENRNRIISIIPLGGYFKCHLPHFYQSIQHTHTQTHINKRNELTVYTHWVYKCIMRMVTKWVVCISCRVVNQNNAMMMTEQSGTVKEKRKRER